jgi:hypothetical protein
VSKPSRNDPCPCGSGRKYKKCCGAPSATPVAGALPHTQADRAQAFEQLEFFVDELWADEEDEAFEEFWGRYREREDELPAEFLVMSNEVEDMWFAFDCEVDDEGGRVIDAFLEQAPLERGERSFLEAMRASSMRLYEVVETVPGSSVTLRDLVEGGEVTVAERSASRQLIRHECIVARVLPRGCSGQPEMERGVLRIPESVRGGLLEAVKERWADFLEERPGAPLVDFYKQLPPLYHDAWLTTFFDPPIPELANTDGEAMVLTRLSFDVCDQAALACALDGAEGRGISRSGEGTWGWTGKNAAGGDVSLGRFELAGGRLRVEVNSVERGARARNLLEELAGQALVHHATTHEDLRRKLKEAMSARALGKAEEAAPSPAIDPDLAEALVAEHYSRHYRAWIDEPIPALDGQTPRQAAKSSASRARVEDLLRELEGAYEQALKAGQPAYDPSWMWTELALRGEPDASHPPPLAHERVAERVPGSAEASRAAAERFRAQPGFEDASTTLAGEELRGDLDLQRFLRLERNSDNDAGSEPGLAAPFLPLMVNFDLHRRKVFWVDEALSYLLESTELDVAGRELRTPFPSFALVFTDRHALSFGERLLSRRTEDALSGQLLRVATVYVSARATGARVLLITFAFDALGADLPSLVHFQVPADDAASLREFLASLGPELSLAGAEVRDVNAARGLLRLALNAILYATSAGVTPEVRTIPPRRRPMQPAPPAVESDAIFFLPGKIDIRRLRQLQELRRAPGGPEQLARFLVRGHWRRPAKNWEDQRLRWIEPYWKGPDLAAVIEKAYRLKA